MKLRSLILSLFLSLTPSVSLGQVNLFVSPPSQTVLPSSTASVSVSLDDGSGIAGVQFDLLYDSSFLSVLDSDGDGDLNEEILRGSLVPAGAFLVANAIQPGKISVVIAGASSFNPGPGSVITLTFNVLASAGSTEILPVDVIVSDSLGTRLDHTSAKGILQILTTVNHPPAAEADQANTPEDSPATLNVVANDSDPDGDPLSISGVTQPAHGSATVLNTTNVRYSPNRNYNGPDSFTYSVSDGKGGSDTATVSINVTPVNDQPNAEPDFLAGSKNEPLLVNVLINDSDPDGDTLSISSVTQPAHGSAEILEEAVRYTPDLDYQGADSFSYTVTDGQGGSNTAQVTVSVGRDNRAPIAKADSVTTKTNNAVLINVLANDSDPDGDPISLIKLTDPANGTVRLEDNQKVLYTPDSDFEGEDSFQYTITDGSLPATATVAVDVVEGDTPSLEGTILVPARVDTGTDPVLDDTFLGIALVNAGRLPESVSMKVIDPDGYQITESQLSLFQGNQLAFLSSDTSEPLGLAGQSTTFAFKGSRGGLHGMFMFGDYQLRRQDGIGAQLEASQILVFPEARQFMSRTTLLVLFNPNGESTDVTVQVCDQNGSIIGETTATLRSAGTLKGTLADILGEGLDVENGYIRVNADLPVKGVSIIADDESFTALAGQPRRQVKELLAPHYFVDSFGGGSELRLLNPGSTTAIRAKVAIYDKEAQLVANQKFDLRSGELLVKELVELIGYGPSEKEIFTGFVRISAERYGSPAPVAGSLSFSGPGGKAKTTVPLFSEGQKSTLFGQVVELKNNAFTGLAILNPNQNETDATIEVFDNQGVLKAQKTVTILPNNRVVDLLSSETFFGSDFQQVNGYIRLTSTEELVPLSIVGDYRGNFLSAVEGQVPLH